MKLLKKRDYTGTVRKIVSDDKSEVLGIVGTFKDLMELGIVEQVTVNANLKLSIFAEIECSFSPDSIQAYTALTTTLLAGLKPVKP